MKVVLNVCTICLLVFRAIQFVPVAREKGVSHNLSCSPQGSGGVADCSQSPSQQSRYASACPCPWHW